MCLKATTSIFNRCSYAVPFGGGGDVLQSCTTTHNISKKKFRKETLSIVASSHEPLSKFLIEIRMGTACFQAIIAASLLPMLLLLFLQEHLNKFNGLSSSTDLRL